ncbi:MAG: DUF1549 domain-containing protein [Planctomycetota bacterium]
MKSKLLAGLRGALLIIVGGNTLGILTAGLQPSQPSRMDRPSPMDPRAGSARRFNANLGSNDLQTAWRTHLNAQGLQAAGAADWLTVCRRLSLAMVGSGLSLEEIRQLQLLPQQDRVPHHRENLLQSGRFHDYWAERFTRFLVGADGGPFLVYRRRRFRTWLADELANNRPYDELVRTLITAQGLWTDRPEVNFYTVTYDSGDGQPDPIRLAARTTRAFLGIRIDCLQCHDDFLGNVSLGDPNCIGGDGSLREGTQQDFHALAAFFSAARASGLKGLVDRETNYRYRFLDATDEVDVLPGVPFRADLLHSPDESESGQSEFGQNEKPSADVSPRRARQQLADWLTHRDNQQFARAAVVRVWTLLFGRPPTSLDHPSSVDDLPLDATDHPMIAMLADGFVASDFDVRQLIRAITDSPPFRVDSRADFEVTQRHEDAMAVFPIVQLRGDQVAGAAMQAGRVKTIDRESSLLIQLQRFGDRNDFLKRYGDLGEDEFTSEAITLTQRLTMLNGKLVDQYSKWNPVFNASAHVGIFASDDSMAIRTLYLSVLNREPTADESIHFVDRLSNSDDRSDSIEDLVWVLLNSTEFAWNH